MSEFEDYFLSRSGIEFMSVDLRLTVSCAFREVLGLNSKSTPGNTKINMDLNMVFVPNSPAFVYSFSNLIGRSRLWAEFVLLLQVPRVPSDIASADYYHANKCDGDFKIRDSHSSFTAQVILLKGIVKNFRGILSVVTVCLLQEAGLGAY